MKKYIFLLLAVTISLTLRAQIPMPGSLGYVYNTISDLKAKEGQAGAVAYVLGGTVNNDFRGAFYVWDPNSTATEDLTYYNVLQATGVTIGRYVRTNQTNQLLDQGMLFRIGPLKILACSGTTNSSGEFTVNATLENSTTGASIFNTILFNGTQAMSGSSNANDAVNGTVKSVTNNKVIVYRYTKGNTIGLLGALSIVQAGANIPVQAFIIGM